jgi:hypothetical protein
MRKRLLVAMVGLSLVTLLIHDVPLSLHLQEIERDRIITSLQRDAFTLSNQVSPLMGDEVAAREVEIQKVLDGFEVVNEETAIVVDKYGYLMASTATTFTVGSDYASRPEVSAALLGSPTSGTRLSNSIGGELVYVAVPVFSGAQVRGVVRVTLPTSILDSRVREQLRNVLAAAFATILLAVLVAFVFARSVSKPIEKLRRATDRFAGGDLSANADAGGPKEIRKLAQSFNDMALRISGLVKRQKSFAGDASHQLRTPLTALRLRLEQATTSIDNSPELAKEHIEEAMNEADRLSHLVEQLLQLARTEGAVLERSTCDISHFFEERADEWDALAAERGLVIQRSIAAGLHANVSQVALREIVDNYIDNAFESSATGGVIEFIAEKQSSHIELIIRDSGKGLTKEQRESAFERFWRGADSANRRSGSGLGLSIVSQLAQASGLAVELRESPKGGVDAVLIVPGFN